MLMKNWQFSNHCYFFTDGTLIPVYGTNNSWEISFLLNLKILYPQHDGAWSLSVSWCDVCTPLLLALYWFHWSCAGASVLPQGVMLILWQGCCSHDAALLPGTVCLHSCTVTSVQSVRLCECVSTNGWYFPFTHVALWVVTLLQSLIVFCTGIWYCEC